MIIIPTKMVEEFKESVTQLMNSHHSRVRGVPLISRQSDDDYCAYCGAAPEHGYDDIQHMPECLGVKLMALQEVE